MKFYWCIIIGFLLITSCKSPEKLIQAEKYDIVLKRASYVFSRKKAPSRRWVNAAEKAFSLANEKDIRWIEKCKKTGGVLSWKNIYYTIKKIESRQHVISRLIPRVAADGYVASFNFYNTQTKIEEAELWIANLYFAQAKSKMELVRKGSKKAALQAITLIDSALVWKEDIYNIEEIRDEAIDSAIVRVALYIEHNESIRLASHDMEKYLIYHVGQFPKPFLQLEINPKDEFESDYYLFVSPLSLSIGGEHISFNVSRYSKEIVTGCETIEEWNEIDSVWVSKTVDVLETVCGTLTEYEQTKEGELQALITVEDAKQSHVFYENKLYASYSFDNTYRLTSGDTRAIEGVTFNGWKESYPSDCKMESNMSTSIGRQVIRFVKKHDWWLD